MMGSLIGLIRQGLVWLWQQKFYLFMGAVLVPLFVVLLFPVDDLSELVTTQVAKQTNNQIYVRFDKMSLGFLPVGLDLENVALDLPGLQTLKVGELSVAPSFIDLLLQRPSGRITADRIFRGRIEAEGGPGKKLEGGAQTFDVDIQAERLQLADVKAFANLPIPLRGILSGQVKGYIEPTFAAAPDLSVELQSPELEIQSGNVNTIMGPLMVPDVKISQLRFKGRWSTNNFLIEETLIGKEGDELSGTLKGQVGLELRRAGAGVVMVPGLYTYRVDLKVKKELEDRARLFLMLVEKHRTPEGPDGRYRFSLSGDLRSGSFNVNALQ